MSSICHELKPLVQEGEEVVCPETSPDTATVSLTKLHYHTTKLLSLTFRVGRTFSVAVLNVVSVVN